jgi:alpha-amylase/alpha-mannosidase (GH57 family)
MSGYICIHGHFYQPPRENPWLERIEIQDSAYPFHDWNARVTAECYAINAASRILDENGRIAKIVNNYEKLSFNFGPSLLTWIEQDSPEVYDRIIQADRLSVEGHSGHGNAIAQAYNHMIMPLANRRDKITQIAWGIKAFQRHFEREPEGMWLPETAVDIETLEILHQHGIRYTILSPRQARRTRPLAARLWCDVSDGSVDTTMPYLVKLPGGGQISVFFFNGGIAHGVAFGGLLETGEAFADSLIGALPAGKKNPPIVHVATDGETFGHHRKFGDMALAYALDRITKDPEVKLTNYGEYLSLYRPTSEVELFESSSWSCAHGVERWRADCGCNTGGRRGWNQAWRGPLRESLDWLRYELIQIYAQYSRQLLKDPWLARDDYITIVLNNTEGVKEEFLKNHAVRPLNPIERVTAFQLLEMQRNSMLMYTSCGWFFDDISGIEGVQILRFAARALELAERFSQEPLEERFLERLQDAKSNLPEMGNGSDIYRKFVLASRTDLEKIAAHYAVSSFIADYPARTRMHCFTIEREDYSRLENEHAVVAVGRLHTQSVITEEAGTFVFSALQQRMYDYDCVIKAYDDVKKEETGEGGRTAGAKRYEEMAQKILTTFKDQGVSGALKVMDLDFVGKHYTIKDLFRDEQKKLLDRIVRGELDYVENTLGQLHRKTSFLIGLLRELGQRIPSAFLVAARVALRRELMETLQRREPNADATAFLLNELERWHITLDREWIEMAVGKRIERDMELFQENPKIDDLRRINTLVTVNSLFSTPANLWQVQNIYYEMLQSLHSEAKEKAEEGDKGAREWLDEFLHLGQRLSINVDELIRHMQ